MTKREQHQHINKLFYNYVKQNFPEYTISFDEGGGRVYLIPNSNKANDSIEYHQSRHNVCCANWASSKTKTDIIAMEKYLNKITSSTPFPTPSKGTTFMVSMIMRALALGLGAVLIATFLYLIIMGILNTMAM
jgi:hypothetical protein